MVRTGKRKPRSDNREIIVLGDVNRDYTVRAKHLPRTDEPVTDGEFVTAPGGKGLNQAVAAARLGGHVALIGCVGSDRRGDEALACLRQEGVSTMFVSQGLKSGDDPRDPHKDDEDQTPPAPPTPPDEPAPPPVRDPPPEPKPKGPYTVTGTRPPVK
jgi:hypothetical protein